MSFHNTIGEHALHGCICAMWPPREENARADAGRVLDLVRSPRHSTLHHIFVILALARVSALVHIGQHVLRSCHPLPVQILYKVRGEARLQRAGCDRFSALRALAGSCMRPQDVDFKDLKQQQEDDPKQARD